MHSLRSMSVSINHVYRLKSLSLVVAFVPTHKTTVAQMQIDKLIFCPRMVYPICFLHT